VLDGCWLSRCFGGAKHRVAGMGSARFVRRSAWPAMVVAARGRGAAARTAASRLLYGSVVAAEAGVRGPQFIRCGNGERRSARAWVGVEPISSSPPPSASICGIEGASSTFATTSHRRVA
jgi:hypothetical protein